MKKTTLAAAVVLGLTLSASAFATDISPTSTPNNLAPETITTPAPIALSDAGATGAWDISAKSGYALSGTEFRTVRVDCTNVKFDVTKLAVSYNPAGATVGAPTQLSDGSIVFSVTQGPASGTTSDQVLVHPTAAGGITLKTLAAADCSYSLYTSPADAINANTAQRIYTTGMQHWLTYGPSISVTPGNPQNTLYTQFGGATPFVTFSRAVPTGLVNNQLGWTGSFTFNQVPSYDKDGNPVTMAAALAAAQMKLNGSRATGSTVTLNSANNCGGAVVGTVNPTTGVAALSNTIVAATPYYLCYQVNGTNVIPDSIWNADFSFSSQTIFAVPAGQIRKDGSSLQATLAQNPPGYVSRIVVTNMGVADAPYSIDLVGENAQSLGVVTGVAKAGRMTTIPLTVDMTTVSSQTRATVNMFVSGSHGDIKAMYQIVNPTSGSVSNTQMINVDATGFNIPGNPYQLPTF